MLGLVQTDRFPRTSLLDVSDCFVGLSIHSGENQAPLKKGKVICAARPVFTSVLSNVMLKGIYQRWITKYVCVFKRHKIICIFYSWAQLSEFDQLISYCQWLIVSDLEIATVLKEIIRELFLFHQVQSWEKLESEENTFPKFRKYFRHISILAYSTH